MVVASFLVYYPSPSFCLDHSEKESFSFCMFLMMSDRCFPPVIFFFFFFLMDKAHLLWHFLPLLELLEHD